jgi:hypothetical protein
MAVIFRGADPKFRIVSIFSSFSIVGFVLAGFKVMSGRSGFGTRCITNTAIVFAIDHFVVRPVVFLLASIVHWLCCLAKGKIITFETVTSLE